MWFHRKNKTRQVGDLGGRSDMRSNDIISEGAYRNHQAPPLAGEREDYLPPSGPPPSATHRGPPSLRPSAHEQEDYLPPPGPPPLTARTAPSPSLSSPPEQENYLPPLGPPPPPSSSSTSSRPPPSHEQDDYAAPPGPPPSASAYDWTAAPPPPPTTNLSQLSSQPQHAWQEAVPDTSLFPPPPAIFSGFDASPANNADEEQAEAGEEWCRRYPLSRPLVLDQAAKGAQHFHNIRLVEPAGFSGRLHQLGQGRWEVHTFDKSPDRCVIGYPPLYSVYEHDPTTATTISSKRGPKTIYYEVRMLPHSGSANLAMGFTALPYPSFRLPGWHRGSLAVHGDDGHKYINDRWGGKIFTEPFVNRPLTTYGIGMTFSPPPPSQQLQQQQQQQQQQHRPRVEIFFTRDGTKIDAWDLHEETDAEQDLPVTGLEGFHDVSCAVGAFGAVRFEVVFEPLGWLYQPVSV